MHKKSISLDLIGISKRFGNVAAISDVSLNLQTGKIIGLLGPNGAGKTTLMRIITGFLEANSGKILYERQQVFTKHLNYRAKIGYLPENNPLYSYMTVAEYLQFIGNLKTIDKTEIKEQIEEAVFDCSLQEVLTKKIENLSKGFKQRVGLASSILGRPEFLVLDEPTSGLDPNQAIEVRKLIEKIGKKVCVLLSTHILPEAAEICDDIYIINKGKIVFSSPTSKIKNLEKKFIEFTQN